MRKPDWLWKKHIPFEQTVAVRQTLGNGSLNTVCKSARCPNMGQCYSEGVATFMILGDLCTRNCGFCAVKNGAPNGQIASGEPERVAKAASDMGLSHIVVTSVTRDDLDDGGSSIFADTVKAIHKQVLDATVEVLTPDFGEVIEDINCVADSLPDVYNHNLETVPALYSKARPQAEYSRSIELLRHVKRRHPEMLVKSGIMLGLGEDVDQVISLMDDLARVRVDLLTIGQYLAPSKDNLQVVEYIRPEVFDKLAVRGESLGIRKVFAGPFVRSSYHAKELFKELRLAHGAKVR